MKPLNQQERIILLCLQKKARQAKGIEQIPATDKQLHYLALLLNRAKFKQDVEVVANLKTLSKSRANFLINALVNEGTIFNPHNC